MHLANYYIPKDIYKYCGAKSASEKALVSTYLLRRRFSNNHRIPKINDVDLYTDTLANADEDLRKLTKVHKNRIDKALNNYRRNLKEKLANIEI